VSKTKFSQNPTLYSLPFFSSFSQII